MTVIKTAKGTPFWDEPGGGEDWLGENPNPWEVVVIAGVKFRATVKGSIEQRNQKKSTPGKAGSITTLHGWDSAEFSLDFLLWTEKHSANYDRILALVLPPEQKGAPPPVTVYHPALAQLHVDRMLVLKIGMMEDGPKTGMKKTTWQCRKLGGTVRNAGTSLSTPKKTAPSLESLGPGAVQKEIDKSKRPSTTQTTPLAPSTFFPLGIPGVDP